MKDRIKASLSLLKTRSISIARSEAASSLQSSSLIAALCALQRITPHTWGTFYLWWYGPTEQLRAVKREKICRS